MVKALFVGDIYVSENGVVSNWPTGTGKTICISRQDALRMGQADKRAAVEEAIETLQGPRYTPYEIGQIAANHVAAAVIKGLGVEFLHADGTTAIAGGKDRQQAIIEYEMKFMLGLDEGYALPNQVKQAISSALDVFPTVQGEVTRGDILPHLQSIASAEIYFMSTVATSLVKAGEVKDKTPEDLIAEVEKLAQNPIIELSPIHRNAANNALESSTFTTRQLRDAAEQAGRHVLVHVADDTSKGALNKFDRMSYATRAFDPDGYTESVGAAERINSIIHIAHGEYEALAEEYWHAVLDGMGTEVFNPDALPLHPDQLLADTKEMDALARIFFNANPEIVQAGYFAFEEGMFKEQGHKGGLAAAYASAAQYGPDKIISEWTAKVLSYATRHQLSDEELREHLPNTAEFFIGLRNAAEMDAITPMEDTLGVEQMLESRERIAEAGRSPG